jgi:hypothetical protein
MFTGGWVIHHLVKVLEWDNIRSYRVIFFAYAGLGVLKMILALLLSHRVESEEKQEQRQQSIANSETAPLLNNNNSNNTNTTEAAPVPRPKNRLRALLPKVSKESVSVVINLCLLFALDSFASGLASM